MIRLNTTENVSSMAFDPTSLNGLGVCLLIFSTLKCCLWREYTLSNEQTALAIRRVVHTELEACATAIKNSDKDAALVQLSEAAARLKRLASGLVRQFG
jgi:prephenate dehydrogenase